MDLPQPLPADATLATLRAYAAYVARTWSAATLGLQSCALGLCSAGVSLGLSLRGTPCSALFLEVSGLGLAITVIVVSTEGCDRTDTDRPLRVLS